MTLQLPFSLLIGVWVQVYSVLLLYATEVPVSPLTYAFVLFWEHTYTSWGWCWVGREGGWNVLLNVLLIVQCLMHRHICLQIVMFSVSLHALHVFGAMTSLLGNLVHCIEVTPYLIQGNSLCHL